MKKRRQLFLALALSLMAACGPGLSDDHIPLGGGYFYTREGRDGKYIYYQRARQRKDIYPKVVEYVYDGTFVLVAQTPIKEYGRSFLASSLNHGQADFDALLNQADSIIANDPYYIKIFSSPTNYWIIDKKMDKLHGPFSKIEFDEQKKKLGVSSDLILKRW